MAEIDSGSAKTVDHGPGTSAWRKRVAILVALALATAGLLILERNPASAASAPRALHTASHTVAVVNDQAAHLNSVSSQLRGAASLLTQTLPDLDTTTAAQTADLASSATRAASLSQQLAATAGSKATDAATAARANATAGQLQSALAATQAKAATAAAAPITLPIKFCNFTIQIGPIIINIPRLHIHIVIGPFFIRFRAPCFLSGIIPTHLPR